MALAVEIELPVNALTQNQTSLTLLIGRAASGDTAAFEQIMILSEQRVMALAWRMLGNDADARDACQEVFMRLYKYLGRFKQDQEFFAWVYQITLNVCRDMMKKRQQHNRHFTSLDDSGAGRAFAVLAQQDDAEEVFMQTEQRDLIARAMGTLSYKERATIVLRDVEGLPTDEVARIMKSSATTVRSQISSGRKKIRIFCEQYLRRRERTNEL
jgi:RNA polymerase sigma-70 factor (ECF subfamily)